MEKIKATQLVPHITVHDEVNSETYYVERVTFDKETDTFTVHGLLFMAGHTFPFYTSTYNADDGGLYKLAAKTETC
jgi:hypothetical protein